MSIRRNTAVNLTGAVVTMLVLLVTVPPYLRVLGQERYGVLSLVWLLLGYASFVDMALGRATALQVAKTEEHQKGVRAEILWTALGTNMLLGVAASGVLWYTGDYVVRHVLQIPGEFRDETLTALPWLSMALPVALTTSVLQGALEGRSRFATVAVLQALGNAVFQLVPLLAAHHFSPRLDVVIPAAVLSKAAVNLAFLLACQAFVVGDRSIRFSAHRVRALVSYGGWFAVSGIVGPLLDTIDRIVVGTVLGAKAVAHYSVPYQLALRVRIIPSALATTLFPRFSVAANDELALANRALDVLTALLTPLIVAGLFVFRPFLRMWVGPEFALVAAPVGQIVLVGVWANSLAHVPLTMLLGTRHPQVVAKNYSMQVLPYVAVLYLLTNSFGLSGAAMAWTLRAFADGWILCWLAGVRPADMRSCGPSLALVLIASYLAHTLTRLDALVPTAALLTAVSIYMGRRHIVAFVRPCLWTIR